MKMRSWSSSPGNMLVPSTRTGWYRQTMKKMEMDRGITKLRIHARTTEDPAALRFCAYADMFTSARHIADFLIQGNGLSCVRTRSGLPLQQHRGRGEECFPRSPRLPVGTGATASKDRGSRESKSCRDLRTCLALSFSTS